MILRLLFRYIPLPVGYDERCERKGYNQSQEAQKCTPNRETQEKNGWVQSHRLTHNLRGNYHVGDDLYHTEHQKSQTEYQPEVLTCVGCLQHGKECRRDEGEGMEVWNQVHDADENAQTYRHRETDDGKTDAEHRGEDEGRTGADQGAGAECSLKRNAL